MIPAEEVITALERSPSIVGPLVRQADPTIVKRRPASGQWSIHEHACHLAQVHPLFLERLDLMLQEDDPVIRSYDPGRDDPADALLRVDLAGALRRFEEDRGKLVERLRRLRPEDWTRTARHDEFNAYSVFMMFRHLALHDLSHAYQIEELLLRKDWPPPRPLPEGN
jgi:uncharacterized damage-inducible protein DinB